MKAKYLVLVCLVAGLCFLETCKKDDKNAITKITVTPANVSAMDIGDEQALTATLTPTNAKGEIIWVSSSPATVSVTQEGLKTTLKALNFTSPGAPVEVYAKNSDGTVLSNKVEVTVNVPPSETDYAKILEDNSPFAGEGEPNLISQIVKMGLTFTREDKNKVTINGVSTMGTLECTGVVITDVGAPANTCIFMGSGIMPGGQENGDNIDVTITGTYNTKTKVLTMVIDGHVEAWGENQLHIELEAEPGELPCISCECDPTLCAPEDPDLVLTCWGTARLGYDEPLEDVDVSVWIVDDETIKIYFETGLPSVPPSMGTPVFSGDLSLSSDNKLTGTLDISSTFEVSVTGSFDLVNEKITLNIVGPVPDFPLTMTLTNVPVITIGTQPSDVAVTEGSISGSLTIEASVTKGTLAYQWYESEDDSSDGEAIEGATAATFTIPTTLTVDDGPDYFYYCVVSADGAVSVISDVATVTVSAAPVITIDTEPANVTVTEGYITTESLTIAASLSTDGELFYQWFEGSTAIDGETDATFVIPTTLTEGTHSYFCEVSATGAETVTSAVATVTVNSIPVITITTQPQLTRIFEGQRREMWVVASVTQSATLSYQWYDESDNPVAGATTATFNVPADLAIGTHGFYCVVNATKGEIVIEPKTSNTGSVSVETVVDIANDIVGTYDGDIYQGQPTSIVVAYRGVNLVNIDLTLVLPSSWSVLAGSITFNTTGGSNPGITVYPDYYLGGGMYYSKLISGTLPLRQEYAHAEPENDLIRVRYAGQMLTNAVDFDIKGTRGNYAAEVAGTYKGSIAMNSPLGAASFSDVEFTLTRVNNRTVTLSFAEDFTGEGPVTVSGNLAVSETHKLTGTLTGMGYTFNVASGGGVDSSDKLTLSLSALVNETPPLYTTLDIEADKE